MEVKLSKILKDLKEIKPDPDYTRQSRSLLLTLIEREKPQSIGFLGFVRNMQSIRMAVATEIVGVLIIALVFGAVYFHSYQENKAVLVVRADELNSSINVKLNEIRYLLLLTQTPLESQNTSDFIDILKKAEADLKDADAGINANDIEKSVEKIKSAEEMLLGIESKLKELPSRAPK